MNTPSVLLPVYNAQEKLESGVTEILEILSELAGAFRLVILDDGSTDDTAEVAHELAARYPQVEVLRHAVRLGLAEAIQTGLDNGQGEVALVDDEAFCLDPEDLQMLWQLRETQSQMSRADALPAFARPAWLDKLLAWQPPGGRRKLQVIWSRAFEQFQARQFDEVMHRRDLPRPNPTPILARRKKEPNHLKLAGTFAVEE